MSILTAPVFALFSLNFYRQAAQSRLSKGFLYVAYLSLIVSVLLMVRGVPVVGEFVSWLSTQVPAMTWTQEEGLKLPAETPQPYTITHPELGPLAVFDTTKQNPTPEEIGDALLYVTATKIFLRQGANDITVYDLTRPTGAAPQIQGPVEVSGATLKKAYDSFKIWFFLFSFVILVLFFFLSQIVAALIYSLAGLLINLMRSAKLGYGPVLNVTFFALTGATWLQVVRLFVPPVAALPLGMLVSVLLTLGYLFFGIKLAEPKAAA